MAQNILPSLISVPPTTLALLLGIAAVCVAGMSLFVVLFVLTMQ